MSNIKIGRLTLGICQTNCYFVYEEETKKTLFFDPADRGDYLYNALTDKGFHIEAIMLTHGHFDHIWGVEKLKELTNAKVYAYEAEAELCQSIDLNASKMAGRPCSIKPDILLKDGEEFEIAGIKGKLIATPGHTQGSCCYYFEDSNILISGDTLFQESVGRTDLPTGSMSQIVRSIKEKLMILPESVKVYPGHGETTTIGFEKENNSFI